MIIHIPGLVLVGLYALRLISLTSIPCVFVTYGLTLHFLTVDFKGVFLGFVAFGWLVLAFAGFVLPCLLWLAAGLLLWLVLFACHPWRVSMPFHGTTNHFSKDEK